MQTATFEFVPGTRDLTAISGIPFDFRRVELGHHRGRCMLKALVDKYELRDAYCAQTREAAAEL